MHIAYFGDPSDLVDLIELEENRGSKVKIFVNKNRNNLKGFDKIATNYFLLNRIIFLIKCWFRFKTDKVDRLIVYQTRFVFILTILETFHNLLSRNKKYVFLFVVTGSVTRSFDSLKNLIWKIEILFIKRVIYLSTGIRNTLHIRRRGSYIIGPGLSISKFIDISSKDKLKRQLRIKSNDKVFIYVGTLNNRDLDFFFRGIDYDISNFVLLIIGDGEKEIKDKLQKVFIDKGIEDNVRWLGFTPYLELYKYFNIADYGLSFIPEIEIYDHQPPYKLFQYLSYSIPAIVTGTKYQNSIRHLIEPYVEFYEVGMKLSLLVHKENEYSSAFVKNSIQLPSWKDVYDTMSDLSI